MVKVTIRMRMDEPIFCPVLACEYCGGLVEVSVSPRVGKLIWLEPPPVTRLVGRRKVEGGGGGR